MDSRKDTLRLAGLHEESIVDGPGIRLALFVQGCPHRCPGCHNPETHDFAAGYTQSVSEILALYREDPLLSGITFSGGEPFCQPAPLAALGEQVHALGGNVVTYTGYLYEELLGFAGEDEAVTALLCVTDLLIDGPYVREKRTLSLPFRGSSNQRILELLPGSVQCKKKCNYSERNSYGKTDHPHQIFYRQD